MYKVTTSRMSVMFWGSAVERAAELEKHINEYAKQGYELVQVIFFGIAYMCIWKKV